MLTAETSCEYMADFVSRAIKDTEQRRQRRDGFVKRWKREHFKTFRPILRDNAVLDEVRGRLLIFDYVDQSILIVQLDPLMAWQRTRDNGWRRIRPQTTLQKMTDLSGAVLARDMLPEHPLPDVNPDPETGRYAPMDWGRLRDIQHTNTIRSFVNRLDQSVRRVVGQFDDKNWQWSVLQLACRVPPSIGLLESNPALGFLVATNWVPRDRTYRTGRPLEWARRHIGKRRREIAARLGFPDSKEAVRVLSRVLPNACHPYRLGALRPVMMEAETMKVLTHLPMMTKDIVRLVSTEGLREHISARLLLESCDEAACRDAGVRYHLLRTPVSYMVREVIQILTAYGRTTNGIIFQSLEQLRRRYEAVHETFARRPMGGRGRNARPFQFVFEDAELERMKEQAGKVRFADPPLDGTDCIVPLTTGQDLVKEGEYMQHCVATYAKTVARAGGSYYIYQLLPPLQRATVAIRRTPGGWRIDQIKGIRNESVDYPTVRYVENWLAGRLEPGEMPGDDESLSHLSAHARRHYMNAGERMFSDYQREVLQGRGSFEDVPF